MRPTSQTPIEELLKHDRYTPEDLALLLDLDIELIRHAAFNGELPARIVDHHIIDIRRADVVRWLAERR